MRLTQTRLRAAAPACLQDMPWTYCLSDECQEWTHAADACTEWAQILLLPPTQDKCARCPGRAAAVGCGGSG